MPTKLHFESVFFLTEVNMTKVKNQAFLLVVKGIPNGKQGSSGCICGSFVLVYKPKESGANFQVDDIDVVCNKLAEQIKGLYFTPITGIKSRILISVLKAYISIQTAFFWTAFCTEFISGAFRIRPKLFG